VAQDERFKLNASRVRNLPALEEILLERLATADAGTWVDRLEAAGVPAGRINNVAQVFEEPQVKHRQMLRDLPHPTAGTVPSVVSPMRFASAPLTYDRAPPLLGQHTEEILRELNLAAPRPAPGDKLA
jgi:crotonobetainyl-CoA:carnitine CoA-transferase CaiB-like acyl-CoA transferase